MSTVLIKNASITDLDVEAIVNAANSSLWAGGGVCGAIFRAAGYSRLQAACDAIGHCDTGSAVITPGFDLKARYIIHAVGPEWEGGFSGEPELLYGAYQSSLTLALENGCTSIGFPLISSGIYGYPKENAWRVAIKAVLDFFKDNPSADILVIFAVLDHRTMDLGQRIFDELSKECT